MNPTEATQPVTLTPAAAQEVLSMLQTQSENQGKPLRIYIEKGGCSGMQYGLLFDEVREGDQAWSAHGVNLVMDRISAEVLEGSLVDYSDDLNQGGFKLTNPNAKRSCGCGKSFEM
jgi:iron-sulfur cluster assembly accessory protein